MKKLAVCIPVYNRKNYLAELLSALFEQIKEGFTNDIQVCISDNCSTDGTGEYIRAVMLEEKDVEIKYNLNENNLGMDRNFLKSVEIADAEYCWFMSSDDKPTPNAVRTVLAKISAYKNLGVMIGRRVVTNLKMKPLFSDKWIKTDADYVADFHNKQEVMELFNKQNCSTGLCGLLSLMVFNKAAWDMVPNKEEYIGTNYIQTYVCYRLLTIQKMKMVYIPDKLAFGRGGNDESYINMGQRIMSDLDGFTKNSEAFDDKDIQRAFLGVLKRHYCTPYLCALKLSMGELSEQVYDTIRKIPYTKRQLSLLEHNHKLYLWLRLFASIIGMAFTEPDRFYVNARITIVRFLHI